MNKYQKYINYINEIKTDNTINDQHRNSRVLIVDGLNTFIRAYAASPVTNNDGIHVGGISGFLLSVGHAIKTINPTRVVIIFDGKDGSSRRRSLYPEYKAHRKVKIRLNRSEVVDKEDNQLVQLMRLVEYLEMMPITTITIDKTEADDVIAYLANDYLAVREGQVFVMSTDKDFLQLIDDRVHVWSPTKKSMVYSEDVLEKFGVLPKNFALFRALIGDESDNIPGVSGLGAKTIIRRFPKMAADEMSVDDFMQYAQSLAQDTKVKIYQQVIDSESDIRLYYKIVQLSVSNIATSSKMKIINLMQQPASKLVKIKFHTMLIEDRMTSAIKNVDLWLREVTTKLDQYCLED